MSANTSTISTGVVLTLVKFLAAEITEIKTTQKILYQIMVCLYVTADSCTDCSSCSGISAVLSLMHLQAASAALSERKVAGSIPDVLRLFTQSAQSALDLCLFAHRC